MAIAIDVAGKSGRIPALVKSNANFAAEDASLTDLQRLAKDGMIRRYLVLERGGVRFAIFGLHGEQAAFYATGEAAVTFSDPIQTAEEMVRLLREEERVDVVICLSHGGLHKGADASFTDGEDVRMVRAVAGIDVVVGGHSHTALETPNIVNGRSAVVQAGKFSEYLRERVITLDGDKLQVQSYKLHAVYDVFAVAPLGAGILDSTAGSALVTAYFTVQELKNLLEFCLKETPARPGLHFPPASSMRFHYDMSRPQFDVVTAIELGDLDRGYREIDTTGKDTTLYSLTCPLFLGMFIVAVPKFTGGRLALVPKNKDGQPLKSRTEPLTLFPR